MKFFSKLDKTKFKPNKNSIKELLFLIYASLIIFLVTEVLSARGTTSYGFIENSTIYLGIGVLLILPISMIFVFKKDNKKYYIGEAALILLMIPLMKYIWDKFYVFLCFKVSDFAKFRKDCSVLRLLYRPVKHKYH